MLPSPIPCLLSNRGKDFEYGHISALKGCIGVYNYYYIVRRLLNLEVVRLMIITRWVCENEAKYVHYFDTVRINWFMIETLFWKLLFSLKPFVCDE